MPAPDGKRLMHAEMEVNGAKIFMCDFFPIIVPQTAVRPRWRRR